MIELDTPHGTAHVALDRTRGRAASLLILGHGAGGDIDAADLVAVTEAAVAAGVTVARVTQPYRVAGRRAPAPARQLDAAWSAAVATVQAQRGLAALPLVLGGRSSGARVACRTAVPLGAAGVLALAFPLHAPGRGPATGSPTVGRAGPDPPSRVAELRTGVPTLVINGDRDPFGVPVGGGTVEVVVLPSERHDLRRDPGAVASTAIDWLTRHGWARG